MSLFSVFNFVEIAKYVKALPNLGGIGRVRSLWEAMSGGTNTTGMLNNQHTDNANNLKNILQSYKTANSKKAQMDLLPNLLKAWAMTDSEYQEYTGTIV